MRKTIKSLEQEIRNQRADVVFWRDKYYAEQKEKHELRRWIENKFDWWIELLSEQKSPCLKYLIKDTATLLGMK